MSGPQFRSDPVRVRVPATSANLGPGFDACGLALAIHDEIRVRVVQAGLAVHVSGEGAQDLERGEGHLVVRALREGFDRCGGQPPGLEVVCTNRIPHGRGLGSSAAAIISGLVGARALVHDGDQGLDDDGLLGAATALEGHPDNVAAALLGGFTVAWTDGEGPRAISLEPAADLAAMVFVPAERLSTRRARGLLPELVPHGDAAFTAGRAALLAEAITRRVDLLMPATRDRLHQDHREPAMPASLGLLRRLREHGVAAVISGAGPSVLALTPAATADAALADAPSGWRVHRPGLDATGATAVTEV